MLKFPSAILFRHNSLYPSRQRRLPSNYDTLAIEQTVQASKAFPREFPRCIMKEIKINAADNLL